MNTRILHINSYYAKGSFYKNLFEKQSKAGINLDVYVPTPYSAQQIGFDYGFYTTISQNHGKYDRLFFYSKHSKILKDVQDKYFINDYSLVHAHSLFSNGYIAMQLKVKYGIPYIVAVRNTDVNVFFHKMIHLRGLGIKILKEASKVVFLSIPNKKATLDYVPKPLIGEIQSKSVVIPNGIDDFWFHNLNKEKRTLSVNEIHFLQVGEISRNKNYLTTLKALRVLRKQGLNVKLNIAGAVKNHWIIKKLLRHSFVTYYGKIQKEELLGLYQHNDIFILPSFHETFGLVYAEAMSQGLPVIYSKGQGFDQQFKEGTVGYHVESQSVEDIVKVIKRIIEDYNMLCQNSIREVYKFDWGSITKQYIQLYEGICDIYIPI